MEKRVLADQANTLVDLCKVREASERIISHPSCKRLNKALSNILFLFLQYAELQRTTWDINTNTDAESDS